MKKKCAYEIDIYIYIYIYIYKERDRERNRYIYNNNMAVKVNQLSIGKWKILICQKIEIISQWRFNKNVF